MVAMKLDAAKMSLLSSLTPEQDDAREAAKYVTFLQEMFADTDVSAGTTGIHLDPILPNPKDAAKDNSVGIRSGFVRAANKLEYVIQQNTYSRDVLLSNEFITAEQEPSAKNWLVTMFVRTWNVIDRAEGALDDAKKSKTATVAPLKEATAALKAASAAYQEAIDRKLPDEKIAECRAAKEAAATAESAAKQAQSDAEKIVSQHEATVKDLKAKEASLVKSLDTATAERKLLPDTADAKLVKLADAKVSSARKMLDVFWYPVAAKQDSAAS